MTAPKGLSEPQGNVLTLPTSIAYMRFDPHGAARMSPRERTAWEQMARRMGALVERMEPFEYSRVLPMPAPITDGGAAAALHARNMASKAGYDYILVYAILPPDPEPRVVLEKVEVIEGESSWGMRNVRRVSNRAKWVFSQISSRSRPLLAPPEAPMVIGEAHLISARDGVVVASSWTEAPQNQSKGIFREKTDPEAIILTSLTEDLARSLQHLARSNYRNGGSIAD